jgi:hypothetical protein
MDGGFVWAGRPTLSNEPPAQHPLWLPRSWAMRGPRRTCSGPGNASALLRAHGPSYVATQLETVVLPALYNFLYFIKPGCAPAFGPLRARSADARHDGMGRDYKASAAPPEPR